MVIKCDNCKECQSACEHAGKDREFVCQKGISCKITKPKVVTNADRIRAMSDEELLEFLYGYQFCDICDEGCNECRYNGDCERRLAEWLKQPAEG